MKIKEVEISSHTFRRNKDDGTTSQNYWDDAQPSLALPEIEEALDTKTQGQLPSNEESPWVRLRLTITC